MEEDIRHTEETTQLSRDHAKQQKSNFYIGEDDHAQGSPNHENFCDVSGGEDNEPDEFNVQYLMSQGYTYEQARVLVQQREVQCSFVYPHFTS